MKDCRLLALFMIILLCLTAGMASAQNANPEPTPETVSLEPPYPSPV